MESLSAYLPLDRRYALDRQEPLPDRTQGAVLFADISDFTHLTAVLAQELGPQRGAEEMTRRLSQVYTVLIARIHDYAGTVVTFSGDAITCWFDDKPVGVVVHDNGARRAAACALSLQEATAGFATVLTPAKTAVSLRIKVAVAAGAVRRFLIGLPDVQRFEVLAGRLLDRTAAAEQLLQPGEVAVGTELLGHFGDHLQIRAWRTAPAGEYFALVAGLDQPVPPSPWPDIPEIDADLAREWLLAPVYRRLQSLEGDFLAELRPVVALFLSFSGLNYEQDDAAGIKLNEYISWMQRVVTRYGGYLLQLTIGDKGSYCFIVFGALVSHEDDPARAIAAALALRSLPPELSFISDVKIGISQGMLYAGASGAPTRRTFSVQGKETNLAARLMAQATAGQILVSSHVAAAGRHVYEFLELGRFQLKGIEKALPVLAVQGKRSEAAAAALRRGIPAPLVGRSSEQSFLVERLRELQEGRSGAVVIEGEAGIGKSRLVTAFLAEVDRRNVPVLVGSGQAIEQSTAYHAWRPIFHALFQINEGDSSADVEEKVLRQLPPDGELHRLAPLLNTVLPLQLPDNELTGQMAGEARANSTRNLLSRLLADSFRASPAVVLILEDAHWLDSASWALVAQARPALAPLLLLIVTRLSGENDFRHVEYERLLAAPDVERLRINTLSPEQSIALVAHRLGVADLPAPVAALVQRHAEGHPFFSEEIAYALRDAGFIRVENGQCFLANGAGDLGHLDFPLTIQGVITSRIDRLNTSHQLTVKVASVIGRIFAYRVLRNIYPIAAEKERLPDHLTTLEELDIILPETPEPDLSYIFKHTLIQEVVYSLMTFSQRRLLHRIAAEWYERNFAGDLSPHYPLLAHHWIAAEDTPKAIDYLEKAGDQALRNFANEEAITFFTQALTLDEKAGSVTEPLRRALWELKIGEANVHWTRYAEGRRHLERGLALLGRPVPASPRAAVKATHLAGAMMGQMRHRFWPGRYLGSRPEERPLLLAASRAYSRLIEVYYHSGETLRSSHAAFHALNLAELAGDSPELAEAYAPIASFFSFLRLYQAADAYFQRALATARRANALAALTYVLLVKSTYETGIGQWASARASIDQLIEHGRRLGAPRRYNDGLQLLTIWLYSQAEFSQCIAVAGELHAAASQLNDRRFQGYGLYAQAYSYFYLGQIRQAADLLEQLERLLATEGGIADKQLVLNVHGLACLVHLRQAGPEPALHAAAQADRLAQGTFQDSYFTLPGYTGAAETYLALWEAGYEWPKLKQRARQAVKALNSFARTFPIGRPAAGLYHGLYEWRRNRPRRAQRAWDKALAVAEELAMPYEIGRLHYEIGRHLPGDPTAADHLQQASDIFSQLGATHELNQAQAALAHI